MVVQLRNKWVVAYVPDISSYILTTIYSLTSATALKSTTSCNKVVMVVQLWNKRVVGDVQNL